MANTFTGEECGEVLKSGGQYGGRGGINPLILLSAPVMSLPGYDISLHSQTVPSGRPATSLTEQA